MAAALFDTVSGGERVGDAERAQELLNDAEADRAFAVALDRAREIGGLAGIRRLRDYTRKIAAVEAELLAEHVTGDGDTRDAEQLLADGKTSKREQQKRAARAKAVADNASLAAKMASGEMSEEQVDVIAEAAAKTNGDAAVDSDLIDKVAAVPPEQGKALADDFVAKQATADGVQSEHDRQRELRRVVTYYARKNGLEAILIQGDGIAKKEMFDAIEARAHQMYLQDGGRDIPAHKHPRTRAQRLFDATHELICGHHNEPTTVAKANDPEAANADTTTTPTSVNDTSTAKPPIRSKRYTPATTRPRIVIGLTVDKLLGLDPAAVATMIGYGPIPDTVLANYAEHADILAALYDRNGEPLWLARLKRHATTTQRIALILRDRGCVQCGADHNRCEVHHTLPWNAPDKGPTDLDQLVLLCPRCHHQLHTNKQTIYRDQNNTWHTRPATPNEIAPTRPTRHRNPIQQE